MPHDTSKSTHLANQARTTHDNHIDKTIEMGGYPTQWSFFQKIGDPSPGFLTPFGKNTYSNTKHIDMSFQQAVITTIMMPLLKLQDTILIACILPMNLTNIVRSIAAGDIENSLHSLLNVGRNLRDITISLASFGLQLLKEVTALITRTLATLFSCLLIPFGRKSAIGVSDATVKPIEPKKFAEFIQDEDELANNEHTIY